jgi:hypothetical protein
MQEMLALQSGSVQSVLSDVVCCRPPILTWYTQEVLQAGRSSHVTSRFEKYLMRNIRQRTFVINYLNF